MTFQTQGREDEFSRQVLEPDWGILITPQCSICEFPQGRTDFSRHFLLIEGEVQPDQGNSTQREDMTTVQLLYMSGYPVDTKRDCRINRVSAGDRSRQQADESSPSARN